LRARRQRQKIVTKAEEAASSIAITGAHRASYHEMASAAYHSVASAASRKTSTTPQRLHIARWRENRRRQLAHNGEISLSVKAGRREK